ncbi:MAG: ABC transporter substrate-binding protein [Rhodospirillales bacterium]|nr:ABC transporter substrate-binding protein [Rhodospirillales bacterium]
MNRKLAVAALALSAIFAGVAHAEDTLKIAHINPLSGPAAVVTERIARNLDYAVKTANANGGIGGKQVEVLSYDNKLSPEETVVQAQKAIDAGARLLMIGVSSPNSIALVDFVNKHNARNRDKKVLVLDVSSGDPVMVTSKCSYWSFLWVTNTDQQVTGMAGFLKQNPDIRKVYMLNPDSSSGRDFRSTVLSVFKSKVPEVRFVGDEMQPLLRVTDFAPYIAKIKASGADAVVSAEWGADLALLLKAAGEAGLKAKWFTIYTTGPGAPTAIKQAGLSGLVYSIFDGDSGVQNPDYMKVEAAVRQEYHQSAAPFPGVFAMIRALKAAAEKAHSTDPDKLVPALEGSNVETLFGDQAVIRRADHQFLAPIAISSFGPLTAGEKFDEDGTGWGWRTVAREPAKDVTPAPACTMKRP